MFKKILIAIACASLLSFAAEDPVSVVKSKDVELQNIIKKSKRTAKETERVKNLLNDSFDFALLAKKSLAASDWKAQDEASQQKFVAEFQRMVRNSSANRLELYRADSTIYEPAKMKGSDDARVVAHLWNKELCNSVIINLDYEIIIASITHLEVLLFIGLKWQVAEPPFMHLIW